MFGIFSRRGADRTRTTGGAAPSQTLRVEALEDRMALSTVSVYDGKLWIGGTESRDVIKVDTIFAGWNYSGWIATPVNYLKVSENGVQIAAVWESALYNRDIIFSGYGGNDDMRNNSGLNLWAYGGNGSDTLVGGWGNDHLFGEGQDDSLFGNAGNDWLDGGVYDGVSDLLVGGAGYDCFVAGSTAWYAPPSVSETNFDFNSSYDRVVL